MADLSLKYTVHGVSRSTAQRSVKFEGADIQAPVPCLVVELVSGDGAAGHSFTFIGVAADAAEAMFEAGAPIVVSFAKGK